VGFKSPEVRMDSPVHVRGPAKHLWEWTFAEAAPAIARAGLASKEELDALVAEMHEIALDESVMVGQYPLVGAWALK
jgi:hypothetical protein